MTVKRRFLRVASGSVGLLMLGSLCGCQRDTPTTELPESHYPEDERDGFQPGGGGMPTYVPTQDGYQTIEPQDGYQTIEPKE